VDARKRYRFQVQWGQARSTDDLEGEVVEMSKYRPKESQIVAALPAFVGQIQQIPPKFSAVKIDGHRAYALARKGVDVALTARSVEIFSFELLRTENEDLAEFEIECGKGTYVRSLARDLAGKLGTCGFVAALERTQVGSFEKASSIGLENLEALGHSAAAREHLLPVETPLDDIPAVAVTGTDASRLRSGQAISLRAGMSAPTLGAVPHGTVLCQLGKGRPVALCEYERGQFRPFRVFNLH
jgi:tRNA pseudouridine55 synthase